MTPTAYLVGLGLWRITAAMDPTTRAVWEGETLHLIRDGHIEQERDYALYHWRPTPCVSPWNSPYDQDEGYCAVKESFGARLAPYRAAIATGEMARGRSAKTDVIS